MVLIFNIIKDFGILDRFLEYYSSRGISNFFCALHRGRSNPHFADVSRKLARYPHRIYASYNQEFNGERDAAAQDRIRGQHLLQGQWYVVADPDEFHHHPDFQTFPEMQRAAEREGASYISSALIDRLAIDGSLRGISRYVSLDEQFPLCARLTEELLGGCACKVVMADYRVRIHPGHHFALGKAASFRCQTHHFKWQGTQLLKIMDQRLTSYRKQGLEYQMEVERFVDYCRQSSGSINVQDARLNITRANRIGA
jgi:hypothetical protein